MNKQFFLETLLHQMQRSEKCHVGRIFSNQRPERSPNSENDPAAICFVGLQNESECEQTDYEQKTKMCESYVVAVNMFNKGNALPTR